MLMRRVALPLAALTALASFPVLAGAAPAGAADGVKPAPMSRGGDNGDPEGPDGHDGDKAKKQKNCPTDMWTVPLEVPGLACLLLLPKPGGDGGGGLGGLLG